jgi:glycosyltransferase involved in cell wall biosynthesis
MLILEVVFWLLILSGIYSMILYPVIMLALSRVARRTFIVEPIEPRVSLMISAFNEEAAIGAKLENSLELDYPREKLEIVVASDGSTDRTDEIVKSFEDRGVKLVRFEGGLGKTAVLNSAVEHTTGEVLVFSDATGMFTRNSIRALASHFADPRVGCVSGRVGYNRDDSLGAKGFGAYQRYVLELRRAEGAFGTGFNASGSIHAMRRSVFRVGPPDTFMDMVDPLHAAMQGYATTFEEDAISMEEVRVKTGDEFHARLRIGLRLWRFLVYAVPRLPVLRSPLYCFQVVSHKFLRWMIGPSMIPILLLNLALLGQGRIYAAMLVAQALYYGLTLGALFVKRIGSRIPGLSGLVFFNTTNLAYSISLFRFLRGKRVSQWVPSR